MEALKLKTEVREKPKASFFNPEMIPGSSYYFQAVRAFLCGLEIKSKSSPFEIKNGELWFIRERISYAGGKGPKKIGKFHKDIIAKRVNGVFIGNSSGLHRNSKGNRVGSRLRIQEIISRYIPVVPFTMFEQTGFSLGSFRMLDKGPDEEIDLGRKDRDGKKIIDHFTGAMLFNIGKSQFLFDIDRNDLALKNFNAFMSRLAKKCETIEEAYASLKPTEVYDAERFLKASVPRQGEWFFIPVHGKRIPPLVAEKGSNGAFVNAVLQSKGNRAHYVEQKCGEYVKGKVWHGGFEHKPIHLDGWYRPVPNTAVESFKISGAID